MTKTSNHHQPSRKARGWSVLCFPVCSSFRAGLCFSLVMMVIMMVMMGPAGAYEVIGEVRRIDTKIDTPPLAVSGQTYRPLHSGSALFLGDRIQVPAESSISLRLLDGSQVTLGEKSDLILEKFIYSEPNRIGRIELSFLTGKIHLNIGNIRRAPDFPVFLVTPLADIRAQNANIWLDLTDARLTIGLLEGSPLTVETDGGVVTLEKPGDGIHVTQKNLAPSAPYAMGRAHMDTFIGSVIHPRVLTELIGEETEPSPQPSPQSSPQPSPQPGSSDSRPQLRTARPASPPALPPDNKPMVRPGLPQSLLPDNES